MYKLIINPETGMSVATNSILGKNVLKNYILSQKGSARIIALFPGLRVKLLPLRDIFKRPDQNLAASVSTFCSSPTCENKRVGSLEISSRTSNFKRPDRPCLNFQATR